MNICKSITTERLFEFRNYLLYPLCGMEFDEKSAACFNCHAERERRIAALFPVHSSMEIFHCVQPVPPVRGMTNCTRVIAFSFVTHNGFTLSNEAEIPVHVLFVKQAL